MTRDEKTAMWQRILDAQTDAFDTVEKVIHKYVPPEDVEHVVNIFLCAVQTSNMIERMAVGAEGFAEYLEEYRQNLALLSAPMPTMN